MIFAAGLGTRLKPMTDTMPKALVPVGGRPLLQILLEKLARHGCTEAVINVHHFADMIEEWCASHHTGVSIRFSDERAELLETGGGIRHAMPLLSRERFLIHNVDILSNADLARFYAEGEGKAATLLVSERKTSRYLLFNPHDHRLMGWTNVQTGEVKSPYPHLRVEDCRMYAFAGIHLFSQSLLQRMEAWPTRFPIIDFYLSVADKVPIIGVPKSDLQLIDVGKPDTLHQVPKELLG